MRLIDADALTQAFWKNDVDDFGLINQAPTIQSFTLEDIEEQYRKGLEKGLSEWETERPQGEWVEIERQGRTGDGRIFTYTIVVCSECGEQYDLEGEKFCPHCGAEMNIKNISSDNGIREFDKKFADLMVFDDQPQRQLKSSDVHEDV